MTNKIINLGEHEAAAYFNQLYSANILPMTTWKYDGALPSVNDAFLEMIGYSRLEFDEGKLNWRKLTPPDYEQVDDTCIEELKTTGHAAPLKKEFVRKDGSRVKVTIYNLLHKKTDDHGVAIFFRT